ncbi:MAG TPA: ABC transporter permease [Opitutaceae bacterium]|jgi:phospholipid/cholesterol/gamma-HCH transport system permease protein|nr:ABC transporter permease [Opitutaceae bacterium]
MPPGHEPPSARLDSGNGGDWEVVLSGEWRITGHPPAWNPPAGGPAPARVRLRMEGVSFWDSSLPLYLFSVAGWCQARGAACLTEELPEKIRALLEQLASAHASSQPRDRRQDFLTTIGLAARKVARNTTDTFSFIGECSLDSIRAARLPSKFRWRDCFEQMQQCGAMGLPIVSLISFLVGLTLAYQAAVELRQFGADIYVADLIGVSVVREMGPLMAAVIIAGRTGAAFAATLGNMQGDEEIDALVTLGISPIRFLVLPRLLALAVMMPFLALYADAVGAIGGMVVARGILQIPASAYWIEMQTIVAVHDISFGLIKAVVFGVLIGLSGCLSGLQADRSAAGVGQATTSAVVRSILLIVVADAIFAVAGNILGI